jgi:hypothetical protein
MSLGESIAELFNLAAAPKLNADHLVIWINAFIPAPTTDSQAVPAGSALAPGTMIPGPMTWNDCFMTDNRSFSNQIVASVRMQSVFIANISADPVRHISYHRCGETIEIDCEDGGEEGRGTAGTDRMKWTDFEGNKDLFKISVVGAANNPLFTGSPDINYLGTYVVVPPARFLTFDGKVDDYPNYESYVQRGDATNPSTIFTKAHPTGNSPWTLIGLAHIAVLGSAQY